MTFRKLDPVPPENVVEGRESSSVGPVKHSLYLPLGNEGISRRCMQDVIERCGQTLGMSSTYRNKKNVHISMCPETFNLRVVAERILYMHDGAPAGTL
jgi:hypothetical protein